MRFQSTLIVALCLTGWATALVRADDLKINTPVISSKLKGEWELQPAKPGEFKQTLRLGGALTGEWQHSEQSLPTSIAWFVEGGELRILNYADTAVAFSWRVNTLIAKYKLEDDVLTLTVDGKPTKWNRVKSEAAAKQ